MTINTMPSIDVPGSGMKKSTRPMMMSSALSVSPPAPLRLGAMVDVTTSDDVNVRAGSTVSLAEDASGRGCGVRACAGPPGYRSQSTIHTTTPTEINAMPTADVAGSGKKNSTTPTRINSAAMPSSVYPATSLVPELSRRLRGRDIRARVRAKV